MHVDKAKATGDASKENPRNETRKARVDGRGEEEA
jgi:hypothetical protein